MSQTPLPNTGVVLPTDLGDSGVWAPLIDAAFSNYDQHDHSVGKGVKITPSGIQINADLNFLSSAATNAKAVKFSPQLAVNVSAYTQGLFVLSTDGELYWRTSGGSNVKLTSGTSINASLLGGITLDYASVGASFGYDDASDRYLAQQQIGSAVRQWAGIAGGNLDIYQQIAQPAAGVPATRVRHKSPASLAASYDLTWLTALPASTLTLQVSNAGQISASNTFASSITAPDYKLSSTRVMAIPASAFTAIGSNTRVTDGAGNTAINLNGGTTTAGIATVPLPMNVGDRITSVKIFIQKATSNTTTILATLRDMDGSIGFTFTTDSASTAANAPGFTTLTITPAASRTVVANHTMSIGIQVSIGAGTTDNVFGVEVTYDRP